MPLLYKKMQAGPGSSSTKADRGMERYGKKWGMKRRKKGERERKQSESAEMGSIHV